MNMIRENVYSNEEIFKQFSQAIGTKTLTIKEKVNYYLNILHRIVAKNKPIEIETTKNVLLDDEDEAEEILSLFEKELNIKKNMNQSTPKKNEKQNGKRLSIIFQQIDNKLKSLIEKKEMTNFTNQKSNQKMDIEEDFESYFNNGKHAAKIIEVVKKQKRQSIDDAPIYKYLKKMIKKNSHKNSKKNIKIMKTPIVKKHYKEGDSYGSPSGKKKPKIENVNADNITNFAKLPGVSENCPFNEVDETAEFNKILKQMDEKPIELFVLDEKSVGNIGSIFHDTANL